MYNKQTWLDEIPDMTKPIYDASGKQKTDPQTGRPLFELVQAGTRITSTRLNTMEGGIEAAHTLVEQLGKELGGNFVVAIDGVMGLLCTAQGLKVTWTAGIAYVNGRRYQVTAGEMPLNPTQGQYVYVDVDGVVKKTTSQATAKKGLLIFYVSTDTSGVISTTDHRVNVSLEEILKKIKDIDIAEAVTGGASGLMTGADAKFVRVDGETKTGAQEKADAVKDYVESRLDVSEYKEVTLQPGLQIIEGKKKSPFNLTNIKGRTLVNLLGRSGGCEILSEWDYNQSSVGLSTGYNKVDGVTGLSVLINTGTFGTAHSKTPLNVKAGKYYVAIVYAKNATAANVTFSVDGMSGPNKGQFTTTNSNNFETLWRACASTADINTATFTLRVEGAEVQYAYFDSARFYEISAAEYAVLDGMTPDQIAAKYPYVASVQPVKNPYAIRYGENLLPTFYEYTSSNSNILDVVSPYVAKVNLAAQSTFSITVPVVAGKQYTISLTHNGRIGINTLDNSDAIIPDYGQPKLNTWITDQSLTFTVPARATKVKFNINNGEFLSQPLTFSNPMLVAGDTSKPFKPREDVMLALQTDLFADPLTGANADEVFEKDGQYFKLAKWKGLVLDGNLGWALYSNHTGYKRIGISPPFAQDGISGTQIASKFDGNLLTNIANTSLIDAGDKIILNTSYSESIAKLQISISNADSGWGDSYTPTADEIKAYFMGWRMGISGNVLTPYNGTGAKAWSKITPLGAEGTTVLPTSSYVGWTPYQLVYQLATPIIEPITSEGQLTFIDGDNQVEVGTGIVLRETLKPVLVSNGYRYAHSRNGAGVGTPPPKYFVGKVLRVFKNNKPDQWEIVSATLTNDYGVSNARLLETKFDSTASYSFTYLAMDNYAPAKFIGSVAETEKALFSELVDNAQQSAANLCVAENALSEAIRALAQQEQKTTRNVWRPIE
ncbi:carbohydrate-binding domain-containing protein [Bacillales bacterium AN1005]